MFRAFRKQLLIDDDVMRWQLECYGWLLRNGGGMSELRRTPVVTPTKEFFPQRGLEGHALAEAIFERVRTLARMEDWTCDLEAQDTDPDPVVGDLLVVQGAPDSPAGTFRQQDGSVVISYNKAMTGDPLSLVATFAHELGHYLTGGFAEPPPGGWEDWEYATDVASAFLGFGIFAANSCFNFRQYSSVASQGWRSSAQGYLSEPEHVAALAIFLTLLERPGTDAAPHLKPSLRKMLERAFRQLGAFGSELSALKAVEANAGRDS